MLNSLKRSSTPTSNSGEDPAWVTHSLEPLSLLCHQSYHMKALVACQGDEPRPCWVLGRVLCRPSSSSKVRLGAFYIVLKILGCNRSSEGLLPLRAGVADTVPRVAIVSKMSSFQQKSRKHAKKQECRPKD